MTLVHTFLILYSRKEPEPEVIYLKHVERSARHERREEEVRYSAPLFTTPLKDVAVNEGERARFEARVEPAADPSLRVEWLFNGKVVAASSRVNAVCQFGYVSLEMLGTAQTDAGQYTVELKNDAGQAVSAAKLTVRPRKELDSEMLARQQTLRHTETHVQQQRKVESEPLPSPPEFVKKLQDQQGQPEGGNVHLEAQVRTTFDSRSKNLFLLQSNGPDRKKTFLTYSILLTAF